jgi:hypothetical protein
VRTPDAFEGVVSREQYDRAQTILERRRRQYDPERLLAQLGSMYEQHGMFRSSLRRFYEEMPKSSTYSRYFGSRDTAYQQLHQAERDRARNTVSDRIRQQVSDVLAYADFFVLNRKLALTIEPTIPVPSGYAAYWPVRPDARPVIDITLGVLLSDPKELEILGYVALPRGLAGTGTMRISSKSIRAEMFGRGDLAFLQALL